MQRCAHRLPPPHDRSSLFIVYHHTAHAVCGSPCTTGGRKVNTGAEYEHGSLRQAADCYRAKSVFFTHWAAGCDAALSKALLQLPKTLVIPQRQLDTGIDPVLPPRSNAR